MIKAYPLPAAKLLNKDRFLETPYFGKHTTVVVQLDVSTAGSCAVKEVEAITALLPSPKSCELLKDIDWRVCESLARMLAASKPESYVLPCKNRDLGNVRNMVSCSHVIVCLDSCVGTSLTTYKYTYAQKYAHIPMHICWTPAKHASTCDQKLDTEYARRREAPYRVCKEQKSISIY
jgi:hypothetical protein